MYKQRGAVILIMAFTAVLIGGAALAGVGALGGGDSSGSSTPPQPSAAAIPTVIENQVPEPADTPEPPRTDPTMLERPPSDEPKEEPKEEPEPEPRPELELVILSPDNKSRVEEPVVLVKGLTHPEATVALGRRLAEMNGDGMWWMRVELDEGRNKMTFVAELGDQRAEATLVVFYEKPVDRRFAAHQKWEVVDGNPAHNIYWGTGRPGAEIAVRSEFGRGSTVVTEEGDWELEVRFEAPCNKSFAVDVSASSGESTTFRMKRVCREDKLFTANQKWEVVDGNPTYNIYWGTTRPNADVWVGSDFGEGKTTADKEGNWELKVRFELPCNETIRVVAESGDQRRSFEMKRACRQDDEFTANQKYGSCAEEVPYDIFYGTGVPDTWVVVESDFGGGKVKVGENGTWEIEVKFPDAPPLETFKVWVSGEGGEAVFEFTNTRGGGDD